MSDFTKHKRQDYLKEHKGLVYKYGHDMVVKGIKKNNPNSNSSIPKVVIRKFVPDFKNMQEGISYFSEKGRLTFAGTVTDEGIRFDAFANMYGSTTLLSMNNPYNENTNSLTAFQAYDWLCNVKATLEIRCLDGGIKVWFGQNSKAKYGDEGMDFAVWPKKVSSGNRVLWYSEGLIQGIDLEKEGEYDNTEKPYNTFHLKLKNIESMCLAIPRNIGGAGGTRYWLTVDCSTIVEKKANCATKIGNRIVFSNIQHATTYSPNVTIVNGTVKYDPKFYGIKDGETIAMGERHTWVNSGEEEIFDSMGRIYNNASYLVNQLYVLDYYKTRVRPSQQFYPQSVFANMNQLYTWFNYMKNSSERMFSPLYMFLVENNHIFKGRMEYGYRIGTVKKRNKTPVLTYTLCKKNRAMKKWRRYMNGVALREWNSATAHERYSVHKEGFYYDAIRSAPRGLWYRIRLINKRKRLVSSEFTEFYYSLHRYGIRKN